MVNGEFGAASPEIGFVSASGVNTVRVDGGEIGGLMDYRREMREPSRNTLGQLAVALSDTFNAQHRDGMDLEGALGSDFFSVGGPQVLPRAQNTGSGYIDVTITDVCGLTDADYVMAFDGATYSLTNRETGAAIALTGSGSALDPFVADGLSIVVNE